MHLCTELHQSIQLKFLPINFKTLFWYYWRAHISSTEFEFKYIIPVHLRKPVASRDNIEKVQVKGVDTAWTAWGQCEVRTVMTGDIYNEEAGDKWTLDTGHNTAQHSAQVQWREYTSHYTSATHCSVENIRSWWISRKGWSWFPVAVKIQRQRYLRERGGGHWSLHPPSLSLLLLYFIDLLFENN